MGSTYNEMERVIPLLNGSRAAKNLMEVFPRSIQFELDGEESDFFITIKGGQMSLTKGATDQADIIVIGDTREFAKVTSERVDVTHPIARGQITIKKGKVSEMTLLNRILASAERR